MNTLDIKEILEDAEKQIRQENDLLFDGKPVSNETINNVLVALRMGYLIAIDTEN